MNNFNCILEGYAICEVQIGVFGTHSIVSTKIKVPGIAYDDWQYDGGFYHNEGWVDYDLSNTEIIYPDEYILFNNNGTIKEGDIDKPIRNLIKVLSCDLEEVGV